MKQVDAELRALGLDMMEPIEVKYRPSEAELERLRGARPAGGPQGQGRGGVEQWP